MTATLTTLAQNAPLTMSSRDIAELTGKRHDNVMAGQWGQHQARKAQARAARA